MRRVDGQMGRAVVRHRPSVVARISASLLFLRMLSPCDIALGNPGANVSRTPDMTTAIPLWEKVFDPPLRQLSDRNDGGEHLAVQEAPDGSPGKLLVLDEAGNVRREEPLPGPVRRAILPDRAWSIGALVETEVRGADIRVADGGNHYAVLLRDEGGRYEFAYKDRSGKTLWTLVPRDGHELRRSWISADGTVVVIAETAPDGNGESGKPRGQRVSFHDGQGSVKAYDFGDNVASWLGTERILLSGNGRYVAAIRGAEGDGEDALVLFDGRGRVLLERRWFDRHYLHGITDEGRVLVSDYDLAKGALLVDPSGETIWKKEGPIGSDIILSGSGRYLLHGRDLIDARNGKTIYRIDAAAVFGDGEVDAVGFADAPREDRPLVFVFGYSACCRKYASALVDFREGRVLWRNDRSICRFVNGGSRINCGNWKLFAFE